MKKVSASVWGMLLFCSFLTTCRHRRKLMPFSCKTEHNSSKLHSFCLFTLFKYCFKFLCIVSSPFFTIENQMICMKVLYHKNKIRLQNCFFRIWKPVALSCLPLFPAIANFMIIILNHYTYNNRTLVIKPLQYVWQYNFLISFRGYRQDFCFNC